MFRSNEDAKAKIFFDVCLSNYCQQRSWGKVMFLHVSVILFTGGEWYPRLHCRWYLSMPCSRSPGGVVSQHALQVVSHHALQQVSGESPGPHPGGGS